MAYYVNMNDKFMSGWGGAKHGKSVYVIECDTLAQAEAIEKAAQDRSEMKYIAIADKPRRVRAGDHRRIRKFSEVSGPWLMYYNGE